MMLLVILLIFFTLTLSSATPLTFTELVHNASRHVLFQAPTKVYISYGHQEARLILDCSDLIVTAPHFGWIQRDANRFHVSQLNAGVETWRYSVKNGDIALVLFSETTMALTDWQLEEIVKLDLVPNLQLNNPVLKELGLVAYVVRICTAPPHLLPPLTLQPPMFNSIQGSCETTPTTISAGAFLNGSIDGLKLTITTFSVSTLMLFSASQLGHVSIHYAPKTLTINLDPDLIVIVLSTRSIKIISDILALCGDDTKAFPVDAMHQLLEEQSVPGISLHL